ncbi:MFS transporter [Microlunatus ginsengisoli]|uniref:MFS transporter n=1 Tax=Microlunatus ginsengisoli TaxID=363863 RepID=A0ABP7AYQ3_9ACTN
MTDTSVARRRISRDVAATLVVFAANGAVAGTWFSRIPAVRDQLHADLRTLGFVLLCFAIGSMLSMPFAGRLIQRFSARPVCLVGTIGGGLFMSMLPLQRPTVAFAAVLLLTGACYGIWNVTMNVHGAGVEAQFGRAVMPAFHGAGSGGIILGTAGGALLAAAGVGLGLHFWIVVPLLTGTVVVATAFWTKGDAAGAGTTPVETASTVERDAGPMQPRTGPRRGRRSSTLTMPVLLIGLLAFCCAMAQGATSDWLAIHAHDDKGFTEALAAAVLTTYAVAEMIGRFTGGRVIDRIGRVWTVRICGLLAAVGVAVTIILPGAAVYLGAALWGLGLSVVLPLTVTAASDVGGAEAPRTVATVWTMAWSAFLIGAPAMGLLAHRISLGSALWVIVGLALAVSLLARSLAPRGESGEQSIGETRTATPGAGS